MALFGRKKQDAGTDEVPAEIKDYYQAGKRDRMWVVWLLSAATFVATVIVVLGLFWGGRWAYRKITADKPTNQTAGQDKQPEQIEEQPSNSAEDNTSENNQTQDQEAPSAPSTPPSSDRPSSLIPTPNQAPVTTPQTGPVDGELPRTGPASDD